MKKFEINGWIAEGGDDHIEDAEFEVAILAPGRRYLSVGLVEGELDFYDGEAQLLNDGWKIVEMDEEAQVIGEWVQLSDIPGLDEETGDRLARVIFEEAEEALIAARLRELED